MIKAFENYLEQTGEIGYIEEILHSIVYVTGLPHAHPLEMVVFENGSLGQILSLKEDKAEVVLLSAADLKPGGRVTRTAELLQVGVGESLLGRIVDPLGRELASGKYPKDIQMRYMDTSPPELMSRKNVERSFETGVALVDMVVPLGVGQRELVIGERKTGKTQFLLQTVLTQAQKGTICIYGVIGQRQIDINNFAEYFKEKGIMNNVVMVVSSSSDTAGLINLTPYTAMTIAEFFRDEGRDVLVVLDDLTTHARYYREISLLAKRFPGRNSYPGDIFYVHARLLERAGNFQKGSITCIPNAEAVLGDISGYIQTNIMAMTDGHIYFDMGLYNQGMRPAVNSFLSVTRVGHQAQTQLQRDVSRELSSFLVYHERMKQFVHFGAEVGENIKQTLDKGDKLYAIFSQSPDDTLSINLAILLVASLWAGVWNDIPLEKMKMQMEQLSLEYKTDDQFKMQIDGYLKQAKLFKDLIDYLRQNSEIVSSKFATK